MHSFGMTNGRRIPLPRSVPYINIIYFAAVLLLVLVADNVVNLVAIVGAPLNLVAGDASIAAWVCCYVLLPAGVVWVATNSVVDGRSPHRWVVSAARFIRRPKRTFCGSSIRHEGSKVVYSGRVKFWWDLAAPRLHHGRIIGGFVSSVVPVSFTHAIRHRHSVFKHDENGVVLTEYEVPGQVEVRA